MSTFAIKIPHRTIVALTQYSNENVVSFLFKPCNRVQNLQNDPDIKQLSDPHKHPLYYITLTIPDLNGEGTDGWHRQLTYGEASSRNAKEFSSMHKIALEEHFSEPYIRAIVLNSTEPYEDLKFAYPTDLEFHKILGQARPEKYKTSPER